MDDLFDKYPIPEKINTLGDLRAAFESYCKGYNESIENYGANRMKEIVRDYNTSAKKTRRAIQTLQQIFEEYGADGEPLLIMLKLFKDERELTTGNFRVLEEDYISDWTTSMVAAHNKAFEKFVKDMMDRLKNPMYIQFPEEFFNEVPERFMMFNTVQCTTARLGATNLVKFRAEQLTKRGELRDRAKGAFAKEVLAELEDIHRFLAKEKPEQLMALFKKESDRPAEVRSVEPFGQSTIAAKAVAFVKRARQEHTMAEKTASTKDEEKASVVV